MIKLFRLWKTSRRERWVYLKSPRASWFGVIAIFILLLNIFTATVTKPFLMDIFLICFIVYLTNGFYIVKSHWLGEE